MMRTGKRGLRYQEKGTEGLKVNPSVPFSIIRLAFDGYGVAEVSISVFSDNVPALLLYTDLGFTPCAVEERASPSGDRAALIHMRLPEP